jgi:hypothetical protein
MAAPDTNVRARSRPGAASARGAGRFVLARLLLFLRKRIFTLDRKLVLLAASLTSACIIPVAPDFQDPPGQPNSPPQILGPEPSWGMEVPGTAGMEKEFRFLVADLNADDVLQVEFFVDGHRGMTFRRDPVPGNGPREVVVGKVGCQDVLKEFSRHAIMAVVADRDFVGDQIPPMVEGDGKLAIITWTLILTCQQ